MNAVIFSLLAIVGLVGVAIGLLLVIIGLFGKVFDGPLACRGLIAIALALVFTGASCSMAVAAEPPAPKLTQAAQRNFQQAIRMCRLAFAEQLQNGATLKAKAAYAELPPRAKAYIDLVCSAYSVGQRDLLEVLQTSTPEDPKGGATPL